MCFQKVEAGSAHGSYPSMELLCEHGAEESWKEQKEQAEIWKSRHRWLSRLDQDNLADSSSNCNGEDVKRCWRSTVIQLGSNVELLFAGEDEQTLLSLTRDTPLKEPLGRFSDMQFHTIAELQGYPPIAFPSPDPHRKNSVSEKSVGGRGCPWKRALYGFI